MVTTGEILDKLNFDKYFKWISPAGVIFVALGLYFGDNKITKFGLMTFIWGIWIWMFTTAFEIKADISTSVINPKTFLKWILCTTGISILAYFILSLWILLR